MSTMGYADRLSVRPGEAIEFKVSCDTPTYAASLVRFRGSMWPKRPIEPEAIDSAIDGQYPGRVQPVPIGSWMSVELDPVIDLQQGVVVGCYVFVALTDAGHRQVIASLLDEDGRPLAQICLDESGHLEFGRNGGTAARTLEPLRQNSWYWVVASSGDSWSTLALQCTLMPRSWLAAQDVPCEAGSASPPARVATTFFVGAGETDLNGCPQHCFNGKIASPVLGEAGSGAVVAAVLERNTDADARGILAAWDFSLATDSEHIVEVSGENASGRCHNQPMRLVVGPHWRGAEVNPKLVPGEYDAIAFHEDDLGDCGWETDLIWTVPPGLKPGVYGVRIDAGEAVDHIPFYIRSGDGTVKPKILYLAPTNTYLAYGNERLYDGIESTPDFIERAVQDPIELTERDHFLKAHPEIGASVYDIHPDHTGICYSSRLRPVVTMRPEASSWTTGHPRHFSADLFLIEWLEHMGFDYDVATDEDLHVEGLELLSNYAVVVTGSHPEYWTEPAMDTLEAYLAGGGHCMYLGGNGFYWVTGISDNAPHIVEIRRGINGTRAWTSHPGEVHLSTTGELGGLWRFRGRFPNKTVGVGFTSQGWGGAPGYTRLPDSDRPEAAFVFDGIGAEEGLGDFGLVMGGAAGDELDRFDLDLGTPPETLRLATTEGAHSDYYQVVIEDCTFMLAGRGGTEDSRVRSDIILLEDPVGGGAVFSVGSINWIGSLMWNGGENSISRMTANVLRRFEERLPA